MTLFLYRGDLMLLPCCLKKKPAGHPGEDAIRQGPEELFQIKVTNKYYTLCGFRVQERDKKRPGAVAAPGL